MHYYVMFLFSLFGGTRIHIIHLSWKLHTVTHLMLLHTCGAQSTHLLLCSTQDRCVCWLLYTLSWSPPVAQQQLPGPHSGGQSSRLSCRALLVCGSGTLSCCGHLVCNGCTALGTLGDSHLPGIYLYFEPPVAAKSQRGRLTLAVETSRRRVHDLFHRQGQCSRVATGSLVNVAESLHRSCVRCNCFIFVSALLFASLWIVILSLVLAIV